MSDAVLILDSPASCEFVEKGSRFISQICVVESAESAKAVVKEVKAQHPSATHVVWAFIVGDQRSLFGMSDDGEPHGTAGRPVLEVLKGSRVTDVMILVIRYFGGTKLGTGGLVSAYTKAAKDVLECAVTVEKVAKASLSFACSYSMFEQVKRLVQDFEGEIDSSEFSSEVQLCVTLPKSNSTQCIDALIEMSAGQIKSQILGEGN